MIHRLPGGGLGKNVLSETDTIVANYNSKLDQLMQDLRDRVALDSPDAIHLTRDTIHQIQEDASLDSLACAGSVGLNQHKQCLDGTRIEILNEIFDWINNPYPATPRIFWLHGQAGRGKSAIAHTVAFWARNLGRLGSCFCFSRVRQQEGLHKKLFPTVARGLADRDLHFRLILAGVIANNHASRGTEDIGEQWKKFIIEPLSELPELTHNVVVVIDALDESGVDTTREDILDLLASHGADLPRNIRILLTSRPLADIRNALDTKEHIHARCLDTLDAKSTTRDITLYIATTLKKFNGKLSDDDVGKLAVQSSGLFEWARLACDYLRPRIGVVPEERFRKVTSHSSDGDHLLDEMYMTFLKDLTQGSTEVLDRFRSVMRQVLWSKESLSTSAMDAMRSNFSQEDDHFSVGLILQFMASLLTGTTDTSTPVRPLHISFYGFLLDESRSKEFFIDEGVIHHDMALASLHIMLVGLRFNICSLTSSYVRNLDMVDLGKKIEENIPAHLMYSCRFWAAHISSAKFNPGLAKSLNLFATGVHILFWMEALGVTNYINEGSRALVLAEQWLQVR